MKRFFNHPLIVVLLVGFSATLYVACSKEDSSEKHPPYAVPTCSDGIQNQGEFHIDCGGPCAECQLIPHMSATIDSFWVDTANRGSGYWEADTIGAYSNGSSLLILGVDTNSLKSIAFTHTKEFRRGVYVYEDIDGQTFGCELLDGIVEFTAFDTINRTVSGQYSFNCLGHISGKKERIINGKFIDIKYRE